MVVAIQQCLYTSSQPMEICLFLKHLMSLTTTLCIGINRPRLRWYKYLILKEGEQRSIALRPHTDSYTNMCAKKKTNKNYFL
ncbi:hypothetical protein ZEAMMB73_Zm00001d034847 [Zea mays]|uniref:Uncharacterized protein n=1 Tax=Zea mays TaxID=4577 RepID=A0A1D6LBX6_MAIZE|nr:hypothetical protein ZEAMMB73_Zm00001d034847 [Zea mays]